MRRWENSVVFGRLGSALLPSRHRAAWLAPLRERAVWLGAAKVGLPIGLLQACINQGEFWLRGEVSAAVLAKSVLTPLVTLTVAVLSAAAAWRARHHSR